MKFQKKRENHPKTPLKNQKLWDKKLSVIQVGSHALNSNS